MPANNVEGYPLIYFNNDGNVLCHECADPDKKGQIYWEGATLVCEYCHCTLKSAYGEPNQRGELK